MLFSYIRDIISRKNFVLYVLEAIKNQDFIGNISHFMALRNKGQSVMEKY